MKRKMHIPTLFTRPLAITALAGLVWLPMLTFAQTQGAGAASLIQLKPARAVAETGAAAPSDSVTMSCPECKNSRVTIAQSPFKRGALAEARSVLRHECPGCEQKFVTQGHGKAKTDRLVHTCKHCDVKKPGKHAPTSAVEKK